MDRKSIKQYLTYKFRKDRIAYLNTSDLFYTGTKVDEKFNLRIIKDLRDKNKNSIVWAKYEFIKKFILLDILLLHTQKLSYL